MDSPAASGLIRFERASLDCHSNGGTGVGLGRPELPFSRPGGEILRV